MGGCGPLLPDDVLSEGLLTNGPSRYRVVVRYEAGRLHPVALLVDNERRTVQQVPVAEFGQLAEEIGTPEQAARLRQWGATFAAEQAGLEGHA